jgi:hypothetical protein
MSKIIKIPPCRNPFVVIINGAQYEYESGAEIEVPDEVAEAIQTHVDSKPRPKPVEDESADGGASGGGSAPKMYAHYIYIDNFQDDGSEAQFVIYNADPTDYTSGLEIDDEGSYVGEHPANAYDFIPEGVRVPATGISGDGEPISYFERWGQEVNTNTSSYYGLGNACINDTVVEIK